MKYTHLRLKSELIGGIEYGGLVFPIQFQHLRGKIGKITGTVEDDYLLTDLGDFAISREMVDSFGFKHTVSGTIQIEVHEDILLKSMDEIDSRPSSQTIDQIQKAVNRSQNCQMIGYDKLVFKLAE